MSRTWLLAAFVGCFVFCGTLSRLLGQTPSGDVEQQLRSQYRLSNVGSNGVVIRSGTVLLIQQDGIKASPASDQASGQGYWPNSYKKGARVKQPGMIIGRSDLQNVIDQVRFLQVGEKAYLTALENKASGIVFDVQTFPDNNGVPYRAAVTFQFEKGYVKSDNLKGIQEVINAVFGIDTASPAQGSDQSESNPVQRAQQTLLSGLYVSLFSQAQLQFNSDGTFAQHGAGENSGTFAVNGNTLSLTYPSTGGTSTFTIRENMIYNQSGRPVWRRSETAPAPVAPPVAPLKLPALYVSAQAPADQLQLNADNTFSLQEAGQTYNGTFVATGSTLKLNISGGTETTATIQGNNLTDGSGQTWVLRGQTPPGAGTASVFQNQDVIKMVKAGLDDALIIAKIGSSKCQFDTSTDALIQLKQNGVSAAVLKAIIGAGK